MFVEIKNDFDTLKCHSLKYYLYVNTYTKTHNVMEHDFVFIVYYIFFRIFWIICNSEHITFQLK